MLRSCPAFFIPSQSQPMPPGERTTLLAWPAPLGEDSWAPGTTHPTLRVLRAPQGPQDTPHIPQDTHTHVPWDTPHVSQDTPHIPHTHKILQDTPHAPYSAHSRRGNAHRVTPNTLPSTSV